MLYNIILFIVGLGRRRRLPPPPENPYTGAVLMSIIHTLMYNNIYTVYM